MDDRAITAYVDIAAPPPLSTPTALFVFGTNQTTPIEIAADRHHRGLAPLVIVSGGVNRHDGVIEGQAFRRLLLELAVPESAIRCEDRSATTWKNVEFSQPFLAEARAAGLPITAIAKWYHLRAVHALRRFLPEQDTFYVLTWDPVYDGRPVTRDTWPNHPAGRRRVRRERDEVARRIAEGEFRAVEHAGGWR
jgi:uncharacterized SAM-binding protein YcdF (DUF218 family)